MQSRLIFLALALSTVLHGSDSARFRFDEKTIGHPPLSLRESLKEPQTKPLEVQNDLQLSAESPRQKYGFQTAPAAAQRDRPPTRPPQGVSRMPVLEPRNDVDYKLIILPPNPDVDFKMIVQEPAVASPASDSPPKSPRR